jgi:hypothetical protein
VVPIGQRRPVLPPHLRNQPQPQPQPAAEEGGPASPDAAKPAPTPLVLMSPQLAQAEAMHAARRLSQSRLQGGAGMDPATSLVAHTGLVAALERQVRPSNQMLHFDNHRTIAARSTPNCGRFV